MPQLPTNFNASKSPVKGSLRDRMAAAASGAQERLMICLDNSGSMAESMVDGSIKMESAKHAVEAFTSACDRKVSAVGLLSFETEVNVLSMPVQFYPNLVFAAQRIYPSGGTNMSDALRAALAVEKLTRAILISDGFPNSPDAVMREGHTFKDRNIPIDCIYIGPGGDPGAKFMEELAKLTGGLFLTVKDLESFKRAVVSLEFKNRLQLTHSL